MICEELYRTEFYQALSSYENDAISWCESFNVVIPAEYNVGTLYELITECKNKLQSMESVTPPTFEYNIDSRVTQYYNSMVHEFEEKKNDLYKEWQCKRQSLVEDAKRASSAQMDSYEKRERPLVEKQAKLKSYQGKLTEYLQAYQVTAADVYIQDGLTQEELLDLFDISIKTCQDYSETKSSNPLMYLLIPLRTGLDPRISLGYLVTLVLLFWFLSPVLAMPVLLYTIYSVYSSTQQLSELRLAISLMHKDLSAYDSAPPLDVEPDYTEADAWYAEACEALEKENPESKLESLRAEACSVQSRMNHDVQTSVQKVADNFDRVKSMLQESLTKLEAVRQKTVENAFDFTSTINPHQYFADKAYLHTLGEIQVPSPIKYGNFCFDDLDTLKLYLCNIILGVKEKHLYVTFIDPEGLGTSIVHFIFPGCGDYFKVVTTDIGKTISEVRTQISLNVAALAGQDIDAFNKYSEEVGKITTDYNLYVILSGTDEFFKEKTAQTLLEYSAKNGVLFWVLGSCPYKGISRVVCAPDGNIVPITYSKVLVDKVKATYTKAYLDSKPGTLDYFKGFANRYIPRDKWFTFNTIDGIDLHFGLIDGDPNQGAPFKLYDGCVHLITGGTTGSGKSAMINQCLMSLCTMYSPDELQIVYIDFKNSEANKFADKNDFSILPHFRILSGTTDGEYALSVFQFLEDEMSRRQEIFAEYKVNNIVTLRKQHPEVVMPRMLVVFDEFKVMFGVKVPEKIRQQIVEKIDTLAILIRAYGMHMWFTAQDLAGTLSTATLNQFKGRAVLYSDKAGSSYLLGSDAAAKLKTACGYIITNATGGNDPSANILWRVPFIDTTPIQQLCAEITQFAIERKCQLNNKALLFDEKKLVPATALDEWYAKYPTAFSPDGIFILGERTQYSENKAPITCRLMPDSKENIVAAALERTDYLNLVMLFIDNIRLHKAPFIINSADKDSIKLLSLNEMVAPSFRPLLSPDYPTGELLTALEGLIAERRKADADSYPPFYFIGLQWEKRSGIAVDLVRSERAEERMQAILREGPAVGIHFIFICKEFGSLPTYFLTYCYHHFCAKVDDKTSGKFIDSDRAYNLPQAKYGIFVYYKYASDIVKFKLYQHTFDVVLESREVVIK